MEKERIAARIASTIESALDIKGPEFIQSPQARVTLHNGGITITHAPIGDAPSALINRRPEAAALYSALRIRNDIARTTSDTTLTEAMAEALLAGC